MVENLPVLVSSRQIMVGKRLTIRASAGRRAWGTLLAVFSSAILFSTLLGVNAVQMLSLVVRPFSQVLFRKINTLAAGFWWSLCVVFQEKLYGVKTRITGDVIPEKENAFLVVNHQGMADILVLFSLALQKKRIGNLKFFVKDVLKYVPGVGWGMLFLDCLFLKRNWEKDQKKINQTFGKFIRYDIPLWLVSFVEGTRLTPAKVARSQAYAREKGLPVLENVLLPRTKGFVAVVQNLREHLDAVYDVTLVYPKGVPTLWQVVEGFAGELRMDVRRFPVAELPPTDAGLNEWLLSRYIEKDKFLKGVL